MSKQKATMRRYIRLILLAIACGLLYEQSLAAGQRALDAYNQTQVYNWTRVYPEAELKYLRQKANVTKNKLPGNKTLTVEEKQKQEADQRYREREANKTTYNVPGSEVNPLKRNWYYESNYTQRYNPMSGQFSREPQGANVTYSPYTQKWEYPQP